MTREEIDKLHFPCLAFHKSSGLVVKLTSSGTGTTVKQGNGHRVGSHSRTWNMRAFSMMENNDLYEDQQ